MAPLTFSFLLMAAALAGGVLGAQTIAPATRWPIGDVPATLRPAVSLADLIIVDLQNALRRQLVDKLSQGGPERALPACHMDPKTLARRVALSGTMAAGFTSDRLRNPANKPAAWAADIVAANAGRRAEDVEGFVVDLGGRLGVIRPIVQQTLCASCHGPTEKMSAGVQRALAERYPADRAIGFAEGEIRGWFWVELPATAGR
ncbi:MAG: DUF3365 domain-containing protein [Vicinamibacterales bacterium]